MKSTITSSTITATSKNSPALLEALSNSVKSLNTYAASVAEGTALSVKTIFDSKKKTVDTDLTKLNQALAAEYYQGEKALDVLRHGESVPAMAVEMDKETNAFVIKSITVHPTLRGMKDFLPADTIERVDALRRMAAFLGMEGMDNRTNALYGQKNEKGKMVNAPTEKTKEFIPQPKDITKTKVKDLMHRVLVDLSDGAIEPMVNSAMLADFTANVIKRGKEWGTRGMATQDHVGDVVLEYVWMLLNGKTKFTVNVKE